MTRLRAVDNVGGPCPLPGSQRARVLSNHHAFACAVARGAQPSTTTQKIISTDPAFNELVAYYKTLDQFPVLV